MQRVLGTVGPDTQVLPAGTVPRQRRPAAATWGVATAQSLGSFPNQAEL